MPAYISEEKLFFNKKPFGSKISDNNEIEELDQENLVVTRQEVNDDSKVAPRDVVATSTSVSKKALTLGDILSLEDSQSPPNKNNTNGPEENMVHHNPHLEITEESEADNSCDDNNLLKRNLPNGFGEISFCEAKSSLDYITYCGPLSGSENLSIRSDGTSASSFALPILQSEWNSSPVRMGKAEETQLRMVIAEERKVRKDKAEKTQLRKEKAEESQLREVKAEETQLRMVKAEETQLRKEKAEETQLRMVIAEERQLRKEKDEKRQLRKGKKGWRHYSSLLCCRF
ncbi:putative protein BREAKING OF ASYMMETRY IN THE STOMATAL LINEAGE [Arabidopsis thaliana]|jgi:hypothetical protein|uniref:At1g13650 n=3 Tax=Arabidopsis TaxID=3701 RepID=A2RVL9_ARATH|nr:uncharacterized protein AT1G13650 [Arabidopsis thaliana]NP_849655.1 uncharacterized protein AT1G13650 [Arabidopsis thaliana]KAG7646202.1 hypothetical protein ISN45_At01g013730 [Arabidopsis thaliana x Arabidopsis arenosa]ABN04748.1 At1g13650 [Arabidopsis thaliana]AEE29054.1 hypothetical protein AT1G13650 [Arabidopsis thaliana]AEE29055.1 hypothetical protein AT1G13650 [Arabidopsis thaliana]OAP16677.1 hypothetical protein AXX17_AT1G14190 [Arabidopsis thaliana]|eukprot:NP_172822.2 hypothetical protein AT1G13650 [Arabidopsis thaliana]